jgi:thiosulfate dehydrogenase
MMPERHVIIKSCLTGLMAAMLASTPALAAPRQVVATKRVDSLQQAERQGATIFAHATFGGNRIWVPDNSFNNQPVTCAACHTHGGRTVGTTPSGQRIPSLIGVASNYPMYIAKRHQVFTLERQLAHCIRAGLGGKMPGYDSPQMVDLIAYLASLN